MSHTPNLPHQDPIRHYLKKQRYNLYLTKPAFEHLVHFIDGATQKGFSGTLTDVNTLSCERRHRTTWSHFLTRGVWDEQWMQHHLSQRSLRKIQKHAQRTGLPIYGYIRKADTRLVTVGHASYRVYRYEGASVEWQTRWCF